MVLSVAAALVPLLTCTAVACPQAGGSPVGAPWPRHTIDDRGRGADGVRLGDVDGDGRLDVVSAWEESGEVRLYLQPERDALRAPWPAVTVGARPSPEDAFPVDLNGDGALDLVSACEGDERTVHVHWAPPPRGDAAHRRAACLDPARWITQPLAATVDEGEWLFGAALPREADTPPELVVGSKRRGATLSLLHARSLASEVGRWSRLPLRSAGWIMSIEPVDLDGDGDLDLVVSDREGRRRGVSWFERSGEAENGTVNGSGPARWTEHVLAARGEEVLFVDVADLDGDGRPELFVPIKPMALVIARAGSDPREPWSEERLELAGPAVGTAKAVRAGDLDRDGRLDLVLSCEEAEGERTGLYWLRAAARGTGWEARALGGSTGVKFDRIELLDLDGDGWLDVLTTEENDGLGVVWYENPLGGGTR